MSRVACTAFPRHVILALYPRDAGARSQARRLRYLTLKQIVCWILDIKLIIDKIEQTRLRREWTKSFGER